MSLELTREADLAADWGISPAKVARLRCANKWPHVRLSRFDVRYTDAQIEQIVAMQSAVGGPRAKSSGLTSRSARRAS
jgi:hypothetical protein